MSLYSGYHVPSRPLRKRWTLLQKGLRRPPWPAFCVRPTSSQQPHLEGNCSPGKVAQPGPREEEAAHPSFHSTRQPSSSPPLNLLSGQIPVVVVPLPLPALVKHRFLPESLPHSWAGERLLPCSLGWVKMTSSHVLLGVFTERLLVLSQ